MSAFDKYINSDSLAKFDKPIEEWTELETVEWQINNYNNTIVSGQSSYACTKCKDKGDIAVLIDNANLTSAQWGLMDCECKTQKVANARLVGSQLGKILQTKNMNSYKAKYDWQIALKKRAMAYSNNPKGWFYVGGAIGRGKSHLCYALLGELVHKGFDVEFFNWHANVNEIKSVDLHDRQKIVNRFKNIDVLYIDDLFKKSQTDADIKIAYDILNHRYEMNKPTIISSEYTLETLESIDEAIASRIGEMVKLNYVKLTEEKTENIRKEWR